MSRLGGGWGQLSGAKGFPGQGTFVLKLGKSRTNLESRSPNSRLPLTSNSDGRWRNSPHKAREGEPRAPLRKDPVA